MNILNKLTLKHLKMNKKRTIVTIVGIILSTALMVGIGTLASTFIGYMINDAKNNSGQHHVKLSNVEEGKIKYIDNNTDISKYAVYHEIGYAPLEGGENDYKPYLYILSGDEAYLDTNNLLEGRFPKNANEIVISSHIITNGKVKYKVGDTINLNIGSRLIEGEELKQYNPYVEGEVFESKSTKEFKIVGIISRRNDEPYSSPGYTVITYKEKDNTQKDNILITYKKVKNVKEKTNKIVKSLDLEEDDDFYPVDYNDSLLAFYGESSYDSINDMISGIITIVLCLIMVGCAIVIYNSFAISVMERKKQFGLFSSIGATKKQLRKTVFYEAFIVAVIGIPIGVLSGIFGIFVVVKIMNALLPMMEPKLGLIIIPKYLIAPIIYMIITILISAFIPAKMASRISPIEAIRLNDDIKVNKRKIKTSSLTNKLFGIEANLALKNMKRNKKKYRITILSLVVSIVLFLSFSAFLHYGLRSSSDFYAPSKYDISVMLSNDSNYENYKMTLAKLDELDSIKMISSSYKRTLITDEEQSNIPIRTIQYQQYFSKDYLKHNQGLNDKEDYIAEEAYGFTILEDNEYQEYIKSLDLDPKKYNGDEIILIYPNQTKFIDYEKTKIYEIKYYDESKKTLEFTFRSYEERSIEDEEGSKYTENVVSFPITYVKDSPKLMDETGFIISSTMYEKLEKLFPPISYKGKYKEDFSPLILIKAKDATRAEKEIKEALGIKEYESMSDSGYDVYNARSREDEERNTVLIISILLYGFIALVTSIGVTSVFNTINTSIALRRKEFAVLRSVGLTPKGFNKMIRYESLLYGLKALVIGIPISFVVMFFIRATFGRVVSFKMFIPLQPLLICIIGVFVITFITMLYATSKIKKENILDAIREENI